MGLEARSLKSRCWQGRVRSKVSRRQPFLTPPAFSDSRHCLTVTAELQALPPSSCGLVLCVFTSISSKETCCLDHLSWFHLRLLNLNNLQSCFFQMNSNSQILGHGISFRGSPFNLPWASLMAQMVKNLPAMWDTWVWSLGWEDPLEKGMAVHSSILAWRIPMDRGAWQAIVLGVAKSRIRLNN